MTATETVNFWVEYIVRNGPNALRSPALDLYWWQIALLDIYGFLLICFFIIIYLAILILKCVFFIIFKRTSGHSHQNKKRKNQ